MNQSTEKILMQLRLENSGEVRNRKRRCVPSVPTVVLVEGRECLKVPLTKGLFTIIDEEDAALSLVRWKVDFGPHTAYAERTVRDDKGQRTVMLHNEVLSVPDGFEVDHKNGNGLDNRRLNLRQATRAQNSFNQRKANGHFSSNFKGVTRRKFGWQVRIRINYEEKQLGYFKTETEAALAYNAAAIKAFGEFAKVNVVK